jgi:glycosyltransferase involved in cell wall biosynthesis
MRILQTPPRLYPYIGGVETVVLGLSRALVELGHEVTVICADEPRGSSSEWPGLKVRRLWFPAKIANTNITPALPLHLLKQPFDVVHTHLPTPWMADWSALIGRARGKGVVITCYNDIVGSGFSAAVARLYASTFLPLTLTLAHRVVVNSDDALDRPGLIRGLPDQKVRVVPNGVDANQFRPKPDRRGAGTIGFLAVLDEFHRYKGLDVLLRAARQIIDRGCPIKLAIGGAGTLSHEYEQLARDLGLNGRVDFLGRVDDVTDFYNACEVFVLPTTDRQQEGFGLVALEAMACGVPVIVTEAAGIAGLVKDFQAGVVVPPGDPASLAGAIEDLITTPARAHQLGQNGRRAVETDLNWMAIARRYEGVYRECTHDL